MFVENNENKYVDQSLTQVGDHEFMFDNTADKTNEWMYGEMIKDNNISLGELKLMRVLIDKFHTVDGAFYFSPPIEPDAPARMDVIKICRSDLDLYWKVKGFAANNPDSVDADAKKFLDHGFKDVEHKIYDNRVLGMKKAVGCGILGLAHGVITLVSLFNGTQTAFIAPLTAYASFMSFSIAFDGAYMAATSDNSYFADRYIN